MASRKRFEEGLFRCLRGRRRPYLMRSSFRLAAGDHEQAATLTDRRCLFQFVKAGAPAQASYSKVLTAVCLRELSPGSVESRFSAIQSERVVEEHPTAARADFYDSSYSREFVPLRQTASFTLGKLDAASWRWHYQPTCQLFVAHLYLFARWAWPEAWV